MKKVFYPPYNSFRCAAADCPRNCCTVFRIPFFKWEERQFELNPLWRDFNGTGACISESLKLDPEGWRCQRKENGSCSFLRGDGLCSLQKKYGQEILPSVCRTYPRIITVSDDRIEYALDPCCPEVMKGLKDWTVGEFEYVEGIPVDEGLFLKRKEVFRVLGECGVPVLESLNRTALEYGVNVRFAPCVLSALQDSFIRKAAALMVFAILIPHEGHPRTPDVMDFILNALKTFLEKFSDNLPDDWDSLAVTFSSFLSDYEIELRCDDEIEGRYRDVEENL